MKTSVVRLQARIDDEMEVEHSDDLSEEEICELAGADWSFTEGKEWESEVISTEAIPE